MHAENVWVLIIVPCCGIPAIPPHLDRDDYRSEGSERGGARKRAKLSLR